MKANSDVTDALRRTIALMQAELERSVLTTQMLDTSTSTLRSTSLQHDTLTTVMSTSKHLITALEKSDWLDRMLILSGFGFFLLVVLFIVKERLLDRGLRIAFWWTRFIPSFSDDEALLMSAEKGMASKVVQATSVVASLASSMILPVASGLSSLHTIEPRATTDPLQSVLNPTETSVLESSTTKIVSSSDTASIPTEEASNDPPVHIEL